MSSNKTAVVALTVITSPATLGSVPNASKDSAVPQCDPEHTWPQGQDEERRTQDKKLVRKLDMSLLPVLILMCLFQAVDKSLLR